MTTYARSPGEYNNAPAPGNNVAYLQLGVPTYRISQMVEYGGPPDTRGGGRAIARSDDARGTAV